MIRIVLAAAAAIALSSAAPAFAGGCPDCKDCPKHAAAEKAAKPEQGETKPAACPCGDGKTCKCGASCECPHCKAEKTQKKEEPKKS